ncbi:MAG: phage tail protein I [Methyloprofundus sp.]|nr:phage tail protein I [Methyloprofundus sp.]
MRDIDTVNLADLVPDSIKHDPTVAAAIASINVELKAVSQLVNVPSIYARIDELGSDTLDHLAWQFDSKVWRDNWPVELKRSAIKTIIQEKAKKGTRFAIEKALRSLGANVAFKEWWEQTPIGKPHTFDIVISVPDIPGEASAQVQNDLLLRIDDVKPVRAQYTFSIAQQGNGGLGLLGVIRPASYMRIELSEAPYKGGIGLLGTIRPVSYLRLLTQEV